MDDRDKAPAEGRQEAGRMSAGQLLAELPVDRLTSAFQDLALAAGERALSSVTNRIEGLTGRLGKYAAGGGSSLLKAVTGSDGPAGNPAGNLGGGAAGGAVKGALKGAVTGGLKGVVKNVLGKLGKGGGDSGGNKLKVTNIVETVDIGAPLRVVYNQWTQFRDFPTFMKKVENVKQESDEKLDWKAQVFWSHRTWRATILKQVPDERIIWRSEGEKGHVDGAVSFHSLAPELTRVVLVLEYHPQGLFERTGNIWRAQGRRARLELKHFARHVMTQVMLTPDQVAADGWRGEIRDGKVIKDHRKAAAEEREAGEEAQDSGEGAAGDAGTAEREGAGEGAEPQETGETGETGETRPAEEGTEEEPAQESGEDARPAEADEPARETDEAEAVQDEKPPEGGEEETPREERRPSERASGDETGEQRRDAEAEEHYRPVRRKSRVGG